MRCKYHCSTYKPNAQEKKQMASTLFRLENKLIYKQIKSNKYKIYCFKCNTYSTVSQDELKQIIASQICPSCYIHVRTGVKGTHELYTWISLKKGNELFGYRIRCNWEFGKQPKTTYLKQVLCKEKNGITYRKDCVKCSYFQLGETFTDGYYKCKDDYWTYFYDTDVNKNYRYAEPLNKKQYYEEVCERWSIKSNQRKIIQDNLLNQNQIAYMIKFDLKSIDDVLKYSGYIKKHNISYREDLEHNQLNIHYLKYLSKNNIKPVDFFDYQNQCDALGYKLDKPRDFNAKHEMYSEMLKIKKDDKLYKKKLIKVASELKQYAYKKGKVVILPFKSTKEIIQCGKVLHNCIGNYVEKYARRQTAIFYMKNMNRLEAAFEVRGGMLIQARTDQNNDCNKEQMKHIRKWCKDNGWKIRL